jgi:hypothetical protein
MDIVGSGCKIPRKLVSQRFIGRSEEKYGIDIIHVLAEILGGQHRNTNKDALPFESPFSVSYLMKCQGVVMNKLSEEKTDLFRQ